MTKALGISLIAILLMVGFGIGLAGQAVPPLKTAADSPAAVHNNAGIDEYDQGYWKEAANHFQEAVTADPNSAESHYNLALALDKMGEHMEAAKHFKQAADLGKENPEIQNSKILKGHLKMLK